MIPLDDNILLAAYFEVRMSGQTASLLPTGHARHFPLVFDTVSRQVLSGEPNFFNTPFLKNFDPERYIAPNEVTIHADPTGSAVTVVNVLDNCYGHALLKLINCSATISDTASGDVLLIVPHSLAHFVKRRRGLSVVEVHTPFSRLETCPVLNKILAPLLASYKSAVLLPADTYGVSDPVALRDRLELGTQELPRNKVVFYYRSDYFRKWGGNAQATRIRKLFAILRPLFKDVEFVVVGDLDRSRLPSWISDLRSASHSAETDFKYNAVYAGALVCIGVTGSHMLLPSLLSLCTAHLLPVYKYKNMAEDVVTRSEASGMLASYKHLYYYGNYDCSNIRPKDLASLLVSHLQGFAEKHYKLGSHAVPQRDWIAAHYPAFDDRQMSQFRQACITAENRKMRMKYRLAKLASLVFKKLKP